MTTVPFYRQQAERERAEASGAALDHVRDRHTRAADAWTLLADRLQRTDTLRAERDRSRLVLDALGEPDDGNDRGEATAAT